MSTILTTVSDFIYLASQSPRRQQLLAQWGVRCELLLPDAGENVEALEAAIPSEAPAVYVQRVTRLKLQAAVERLRRRSLPLAPVLCADTTVALGRRIMGKPADAADAQRMLTDLAGRRHRVLTAVAVACPAALGPLQQWAAMSVSWVTFDDWSAADIGRYVASQEPMGKAGAYAIQGAAALHIRYISGSYSGIMGLPAHETATVLRAAGVHLAC